MIAVLYQEYSISLFEFDISSLTLAKKVTIVTVMPVVFIAQNVDAIGLLPRVIIF